VDAPLVGAYQELISSTLTGGWPTPAYDSYLVDSASSHMLVSKIKPCKSKFK
jgi:hypothetical protein